MAWYSYYIRAVEKGTMDDGEETAHRGVRRRRKHVSRGRII
jgi:hypothetical protein